MKKLPKQLLANLGLAVIIASFIFYFSDNDLLKRLGYNGLDFSFRLRGSNRPAPKLIIVEITDSDLAKVGRWPWDRAWMAVMTQTLKDLGARMVLLDIVFSEPADDRTDALFEESLKINPNVYLPLVFDQSSISLTKALTPLERFGRNARGTGSINISPDIDGIIRRSRLIFRSRDTIFPSMSLTMASDYLGLPITMISDDQILLSDGRQSVRIPLIEKDTLLINWSGKWRESFKHYSFLEVLAAYQNSRENRYPGINLDEFKDSVCLVGLTAVGLYDIKAVPMEPEYPGIGVTATIINNIINRDFLINVSPPLNLLLLYALCLIPALVMTGTNPLREILFVILLAVSYFYINFQLFTRGVILNLASPLLGIFFTYTAVWTNNFLRIARERQQFFTMSVTDSLTGLFNIGYFRILLETELMLAAPDQANSFCVVMSDIDHFKQFNDTFGHQTGDMVLKEVAGIIKNSVRSADIVARYGGEEMIILLRGIALKEGLMVAEKTRKNVETRTVARKDKRVTVSFGVSAFKKGDTVDSIIRRADEGLYRAKESGRNRVCTAEEE